MIAILRQEPDQLQNQNLRFESDHDNLDYLRHARLVAPSGKVFALVRHERAPSPGTEVVTRDDSVTLLRDLEEVLGQLCLTPNDLVWEHPKIKAVRVAEPLLHDVASWMRALIIIFLAATAALLGMAAVALFKSDRDFYVFGHVFVLGVFVIADIVVFVLILPAYRRLEPFFPKRRGFFTNLLDWLLDLRKGSHVT